MHSEWSDPYNSFNSYKGLLYKNQFDGIISGKFLPPVEVNIDPCNNCNLDCIWCNGKDVIDRQKKVMMTKEHLMDLVKFCSDWGVKAICYAGGGEAVMHPDLAEAIELTNELGMESALITNGLFLNSEQMERIASKCRWIGVSVDCANSETYKKVKNSNEYFKLIDNIRHLVDYKAREVTYKFLIHPLNQREIYSACFLAKTLGCHGFHARLISNRYLDKEEFKYEEINRQLDYCRNLEDENFKVYTIRHKQDGEGNRRIRFDKCQASPLLCMFEADGTTSICIDRKGQQRTMLCRHDNPEDIRKIWGSEEHKRLLNKINPDKDCPKCTMTIYQELLEAYKDDKFCWRFP